VWVLFPFFVGASGGSLSTFRTSSQLIDCNSGCHYGAVTLIVVLNRFIYFGSLAHPLVERFNLLQRGLLIHKVRLVSLNVQSLSNISFD
jgi:hypothetical protein